MGQSTDAILLFGVDLGDGEDVEWPEALASEEDGAWPELDRFIAAKAGLVEPSGEDYKTPEWSAYFRAKRAAEEAFPVDLVSHCSGEYPMWIAALRMTVQRARRGHPVTPIMGDVTPEDVAALKAFCEETGLPWSEPKWLLCSDWS